MHGILGQSVLHGLRYYDPVLMTNIDSMHSIFYGVVKILFKYWFTSPISKEYSLKSQMDKINGRLMSIKPPSFISVPPRSIYDWENWRCKEFMIFILYYSLYIFHEIMPFNLNKNLTCLVTALEHLFTKSIKRDSLKSINDLLNKFVKDLSGLYGKRIMNSGVHEPDIGIQN